MQKTLILTIASLFIVSCSGNPDPCSPTNPCPPIPTPEPKPIPPEAQQCHLMQPPASYNCYDNPPDGETFDKWQPNWGFVCAPINGQTYRVETPDLCTQPPPPGEGCDSDHKFPQGVDDQLVGLDYHTNRFRNELNEVMGRMTGCGVNTDCPIPVGPDEWMNMVCDEMCKLGYFCGRHRDTPGQQASDQISISQVPWCQAPHTQQQIFNFGATPKVRWSSTGPAFNDWEFSPNAPYCNSTPVSSCPNPVTPKVSKWSQGTPKAHGPSGCFDSTPLFYDGLTTRWDGTQINNYCKDTGQDGKLHCPARLEGHSDRLACEKIGVSGNKDGEPLWQSDGNMIRNPNAPDNIFQMCTDGSWIQVCAADGTVCSVKREL